MNKKDINPETDTENNPETVQLLFEEVGDIHKLVKKLKGNYPLKDIWLNVNETCELLRISKRTLQSYRDNRVLSYSQINGKIYFKASDIEEHFQKHYKKAND